MTSYGICSTRRKHERYCVAMNDSDNWPAQWTKAIGASAKARRKELGLSAEKVAQRCTDLGFPIPRNTIANLESGRKASLPVHELAILARALETSPTALAVPAPELEHLQVGDVSIPIDDAIDWFSGSGVMSGDWLQRWREHGYLAEQIDGGVEALSQRAVLADPKVRQQYEGMVALLRRQRKELEELMVSRGERLPSEPMFTFASDEERHDG